MIFLIRDLEERNVDLNFQDEKRKDQLIDNYGGSIIKQWETTSCTWYIEGEREEMNSYDFFFFLGYIPICNEEVFLSVQAMTSFLGVEFLPIMVENVKYYVLNVLQDYNGIVNLRKSKVKYYGDGDVLWIDEYVFYPFECTSFFFRIGEVSTVLFVNESFRKLYLEKNWSGINFIQCKVRSQSFLDRILNK